MNKTACIIILILMPLFGFTKENLSIKNETIQLVYPVDMEVPFTRDDFFTFIWSDKISEYAPFEFKLVPLYDGQSPKDALAYNTPIFVLTKITDYYINYPWNAPGLEEGNYVWQISSEKSKIDPGYAIFSINPEAQIGTISRYTNKYTELKEKLDGGYQIAYDKRLRIQYNELYEVDNQQCLRFIIRNKLRENLVVTDKDGKIDTTKYLVPPVSIRRKVNYLEINLETCAGIELDYFYTLEVWNEKGERYYLRFCPKGSYPFYEGETGMLYNNQ
jgi:hypothetical protein